MTVEPWVLLELALSWLGAGFGLFMVIFMALLVLSVLMGH